MVSDTDYTQYSSLDKQVVFITGGATGIGAELVRAFTLQGVLVAFIDLNQQAGETLQSAIENETGNKPWFKAIDVCDIQALESAISSAADELGGLHCLVNNVANDQRHRAEEMSADAWRQCMSVNLDATYFAAKAALPFLKKNGGSIINFSSINALLGPENMSGYVTAKMGLLGMTKSLAREWGHYNIRVNAVLPGWVVTDRQLALWLTPEAEQEWMKQVAIERRLMPADVANLCLFLASDDSSMMTGQSLVIDGGRT